MNTLAYELLEEIVSTATTQLLSNERNPPSPPHPQAQPFQLASSFLLSISLVSKQWAQIGQDALLRAGIVTPEKAASFLAQLKATGVLAREVRVGLEAGTLAKGHGVGEWELMSMIRSLLEQMTGLQTIEFVRCVPAWNRWPAVSNRLSHLIFTRQTSLSMGTALPDSRYLQPSHITFSRDLSTDQQRERLPQHLPLLGLHQTFPSLPYLSVVASSAIIQNYLRNLSSRTSALQLTRLDIECRDVGWMEDGYAWPDVAFMNIIRLSTQLETLPRTSRNRLPRSIQQLQIISEPYYVQHSTDNLLVAMPLSEQTQLEMVTEVIRDAIRGGPNLKVLSLPAGLDVDMQSVREACAEEGIVLSIYVKEEDGAKIDWC
ncbi:hypothetical protein P7C70_g332, partial [Phenoliferia sp. Uapishka_3]